MLLFSLLRKPLDLQCSSVLPAQHSAGGSAGGSRIVPPPGQQGRTALWTAVAVAVGVAIIAFVPHRDSERADLAQIQQQAASGEPKAELELGIDYQEGLLGLNRDPSKADEWLTKAAEGGDSEAAALLGDAYSEGSGVPRDLAAAEHWWQEAAKKGNVHAEAELGMALEQNAATLDRKYEGQRLVDEATGQEEPGMPTPTLATAESITVGGQTLASLSERARAGDSVAEYQLALRYRSGAYDVNRDPQKALFWLRRSAEHGNPVAMGTLATAYEKGQLGLTADAAQAQLWRENAKAAQQGIAEVKKDR